jgi:hypothetical protein
MHIRKLICMALCYQQPQFGPHHTPFLAHTAVWGWILLAADKCCQSEHDSALPHPAHNACCQNVSTTVSAFCVCYSTLWNALHLDVARNHKLYSIFSCSLLFILHHKLYCIFACSLLFILHPKLYSIFSCSLLFILHPKLYSIFSCSLLFILHHKLYSIFSCSLLFIHHPKLYSIFSCSLLFILHPKLYSIFSCSLLFIHHPKLYSVFSCSLLFILHHILPRIIVTALGNKYTSDYT